MSVGGGGTLEFQSSVAAVQTVEFKDANGTVQLDDPSGFAAHISGISGIDDVLDIQGLVAADTTATTGSGSYDADTNLTTLTITDSSDNATVTLYLVGNYSTSTWTVQENDSGNGVDIFDPPATSAAAARSGETLPAASPAIAPHQSDAGHGAARADDIAFTMGGRDAFVFKPDLGKDTSADPHAEAASGPPTLYDHSAFHFASYQALLAAADPEEGSVDIDGHGPIFDAAHHTHQMHADLLVL